MPDEAGSDRIPADGGVVPGLYWGVRGSFVRYVLGNPDGQLYGDDGVETDGEGTFRFPLSSVEHEGEDWLLSFRGEVAFAAHGGLLAVRIAQPILELRGGDGTLSVRRGAEYVVIARVRAAQPVAVDDAWLVFPPLPAALTAEGVSLFGDVYAEGDGLDPLRIALPASSATPEASA